MIFDPNKMSWITRLRLCWTVLTKGAYNTKMYRTRHAQRQWDMCRQRDKELQRTCRPRSGFPQTEWWDQ